MAKEQVEELVDQFETTGELTVELHRIEGQNVKVKVLVEQITDPESDKPTFLIHRYGIHLAHDYYISPAYAKSKKLHYIPVERAPFPKVGLPDWDASDEELYDEIVAYVRKHVYFTSENMYYVLSSYCLATWVYESFSSFPYIFVLGDFGVGKTRLLEVIQALSHRGLMTPNASDAVIYTIGQYWKPTLLYDESEGLGHEAKQAIIGIANAGYKRNGGYVFRTKFDRDGRRGIESFDVYFPKVFAGTKELAKTLESRCIHFKMVEKPKHIKLNAYMDEATAFGIRNKLLAYRISNLSKTNDGFLEMDVENSRIMELFTPLLAVTPEKFQHYIKEYAKKTEAIQRATRSESFAIPLLEAIIDTYGKCKDDKLYLTQIKELLFSEQIETTDGKPLTERFIRKQLKEIGFDVETIRRDMRSRYILWDDQFKNWLASILPQYFKDKRELDQMLSRIGITEIVQATLGGV